MTALYEARALADRAVEKLRVYAQPQRLMILSCLSRGERTVGGIDAATGIGQPALSQQLAELRRAGMVRTRRAAKQVHYDLADEGVRLCVRSMEAIFGDGPAAEAMPAAHGAGQGIGSPGGPGAGPGLSGAARAEPVEALAPPFRDRAEEGRSFDRLSPGGAGLGEALPAAAAPSAIGAAAFARVEAARTR